MLCSRLVWVGIVFVSSLGVCRGDDDDVLVRDDLPTVSFDEVLSFTQTGSGVGQHPVQVQAKRHHKSKNKKITRERSTPDRSAQSPEKKEDSAPHNDPERDLFQWFQTYAEVVSLVQKKGFKTVDFAKFIQNSLKSAVSNVDAHSAFFDQDSYKSVLEATSGEFSGIGVSIIGKTPEDDALVVIDVIQGGPADKAGMKSGDKLVEVNQEKLKGLSTDEAVNKLKGKLGTEVVLKAIRDKKPIELKMKRDIIKDQTSICYYFKEQNIYYLSLTLFTENAATQMAQLLKKANEGMCKGIVLDLRRNPGGTLDSAIDMAGLFLPKRSSVVVTKNNQKATVSEYFTRVDPLLQSDVPIFILINNFTASAAEILAGCLLHHSKKGVQVVDKNGKKHSLMVFLVGTPTFGKGSVQELMPIKNGCALKLTTMLYFLPEMTSLQAIGIQPDFLVRPKYVPVDEMKWIAEFYGKESALKNHISVKEVEKAFGIKLPKEAEQEEAAIKKATNALEDIVEFDDEASEARRITRLPGEKSETGPRAEKSWEDKRREDLALDVQVQSCVNMINLFALAKKISPARVVTRAKALGFLQENYLTDRPATVEKVE